MAAFSFAQGMAISRRGFGQVHTEVYTSAGRAVDSRAFPWCIMRLGRLGRLNGAKRTRSLLRAPIHLCIGM